MRGRKVECCNFWIQFVGINVAQINSLGFWIVSYARGLLHEREHSAEHGSMRFGYRRRSSLANWRWKLDEKKGNVTNYCSADWRRSMNSMNFCETSVSFPVANSAIRPISSSVEDFYPLLPCCLAWFFAFRTPCPTELANRIWNLDSWWNTMTIITENYDVVRF